MGTKSHYKKMLWYHFWLFVDMMCFKETHHHKAKRKVSFFYNQDQTHFMFSTKDDSLFRDHRFVVGLITIFYIVFHMIQNV